MINKFQEIIEFIKSLYPNQNPVPLHAPVFLGKEKEYLQDCIDSTYVSYVGKYVNRFEEMTAEYTGAKYAIAVVNGTAALQIALQLAGVKYGDEVITQPLTFVATANAISHCGAKPVFVDVDPDRMGMSPEKLNDWLAKNIKLDKLTGKPYNHTTIKPVSAIVPVHTFGHPCRIDEIVEVANKYNIPVIEDAAESLGSWYAPREIRSIDKSIEQSKMISRGKHTGTFGLAGILSYNGNKTITTGGGGMIITDDEKLAKKAKHITTTAKVPHKWEYIHDEIGYNYRLTNVNAALGVAQMEYFDKIIQNKRETAELYKNFFSNKTITFFAEPQISTSNYWLNVIQFKKRSERDSFLEFSNENGVMTRPVWHLMNKLK
ncbi:MAG: LegC family aminotransferase, partial [Ignavibacterium sp.]|nr:LegC family aminotransferase [Ignavibacterium sp.]